MNDEYYYIKIKSPEYDRPDWFLTDDGVSSDPKGVRVFDDIVEAIEIKNQMKSSYPHCYFDIVRF